MTGKRTSTAITGLALAAATALGCVSIATPANAEITEGGISTQFSLGGGQTRDIQDSTNQPDCLAAPYTVKTQPKHGSIQAKSGDERFIFATYTADTDAPYDKDVDDTFALEVTLSASCSLGINDFGTKKDYDKGDVLTLDYEVDVLNPPETQSKTLTVKPGSETKLPMPPLDDANGYYYWEPMLNGAEPSAGELKNVSKKEPSSSGGITLNDPRYIAPSNEGTYTFTLDYYRGAGGHGAYEPNAWPMFRVTYTVNVSNDAPDSAEASITFRNGDKSFTVDGSKSADGAWQPDSKFGAPAAYDVNLASLDAYDVYGWNTKQDGTGAWYYFLYTESDRQYVLSPSRDGVTAGTTMDYPENGTLYAVKTTSKNAGKLVPSKTKATKQELKDLTFTTTGWGGSNKLAVRLNACAASWATSQPDYTAHCLPMPGHQANNGIAHTYTWQPRLSSRLMVGADGTSKAMRLNDSSDFNAFIDAAFADEQVKYINVTAAQFADVSGTTIGSIELNRDSGSTGGTETPDPEPTPSEPTVVTPPANTELSYGQGLDLNGIKVDFGDGQGVVDATGMTVSGYDSSKPGVQKVVLASKKDPTKKVTIEVLVGFKDVDSSTPHHEEINLILKKDITRGFPDGTFGGMRSLNRQDLAAFLYRMAGQPDYTPSKEDFVFTDVTTSTPHYREILWAAKNGVVKGYDQPDGTRTYAGGRDILRQDMIAMLYRLAGSLKVDAGQSFSDVTDATPHHEAIAWAKQAGVTTGFPNGTFQGGDTIVRQDTAAFLGRMIDKNLIKF